MKIRIEIEIGTIVIADEHRMPDAGLAQAIAPRALLDQIEAGLWSKMSVAVDKALSEAMVKHRPVQEPGRKVDRGMRFDVA